MKIIYLISCKSKAYTYFRDTNAQIIIYVIPFEYIVKVLYEPKLMCPYVIRALRPLGLGFEVPYQ